MLSCRSALISLVLASIGLCFAQQKAEKVEASNGPTVETALGTVDFPNSCTQAAQPAFVRGVVLLHSFQYSASEQAFTDAAKADPRCAMAYWGTAMTVYHPLWEGAGEKALARGRGYLAKIQGDWPVTPREREYIGAIRIIFNAGQKLGDDRITDYSRAMGELHKHFPQDGEATAFYALSLLALPKGDDMETRKKAIAILTKLSADLPQHPGAAHYLIHAADTPELAQQGLDAARRYARIAPDSSHALHMPAHIFVRLGLWQESIDSDLAAAISAEQATKQHLGEAHYQFHAMDFLDYSYLQMGEESKARQIIADLDKVPGSSPGEVSNMRVNLSTRNILELHQWKQALELKPEGELLDQQLIFYTRAIAAARLDDGKAAKENYNGLKKAMKREKEDRYKLEDFRVAEVEAWVDFAKGKRDKAVKIMGMAAEKQDRDSPGGFNVPAREMLADMLMELHKPTEALMEYEAVLKTEPNRFNGLYGAVTAAQMAGDSGKASTYYSQLKEICAPQADREELQRAKMIAAGSGTN